MASQPDSTMRRKCLSSTHFMVTRLVDTSSKRLKSPRYWRTLFAICCDPIRRCEALVVLLLYPSRYSGTDNNHFDIRFQVQDTKWQAQSNVSFVGNVDLPAELLESCGMKKHAVNMSPHNRYRQIWGLSTVHLLSLFLFAYTASGVIIGGYSSNFCRPDGRSSSTHYI